MLPLAVGRIHRLHEGSNERCPCTQAGRMTASEKSVEASGDDVDRASQDSFPASDPPPWNGVRLGSPRDANDDGGTAGNDPDDDTAFGERPAESRGRR